MVNSEAFIKRLEEIMLYYGVSGSAFADAISVPRSSISHLLSGRNKPSLDFVLKVIASYPEVNLYWLLNGKGDFPNTPTTSSSTSKEVHTPTPPKALQNEFEEADTPLSKRENSITISNTTNEVTQQKPQPSLPDSSVDKKVSKILICYTDGSFDAYHPNA